MSLESDLLLHSNAPSAPCTLTATGRGQDNRGHRRSAATPHNQCSWEHAKTCGKTWPNVATRAQLEQQITTCMEVVALL